jgi:hypothetical protein
MEPEPMREWEYDRCGAQAQAAARPAYSCSRCGILAWIEMLRGEGNSGDFFRPGPVDAA